MRFSSGCFHFLQIGSRSSTESEDKGGGGRGWRKEKV